MPKTSRTRGRVAVLMAAITIVLLAPLAYSIVSSLFAQQVDRHELFLEMPAPQHQECVRDTPYMRYHHWELLRETREEVVRYGKRGEVGLFMCKNCHKSREKFCNQCHNAASVYPDCYGCHYYP